MSLDELRDDLLEYCKTVQAECDYEISGPDADKLVDQLTRVLALVEAAKRLRKDADPDAYSDPNAEEAVYTALADLEKHGDI